MLDENRVKLMTRMASYEDTEGKKMIPISHYFRSDYVGFNMVKTAVSVTIALGIILGVYIFCNIDTLLAGFYKMDLKEELRKLASLYAVILGIYLFISFLLYTYRYNVAKKSVRSYNNALRRLSAMYSASDREL